MICRSNPVVYDPRVEKTANALAAAGYSVCIVCWDRSGELAAREIIDHLEYIRIRIPSRYGTGLRNLFPLLLWQIRLLLWLFNHRNQYDLIHACDFDTILPSLLMKKITHQKKVIYDIFDFYAENLRHTPECLKNVIRKIDLAAIEHADHIILVDESRRQEIGKARAKQVSIINNTPQDTCDSHTDTHPKQGKTGFRLAYVGQLIHGRSLAQICEILKSHPDWHFDLAGFGADQNAIIASAHSSPNIRWHGAISYEQALQIYSEADVLLAIYDPTIPNHRTASPNKVFEAMMLQKPVIVAAGTSIDRFVSDNKIGMVVKYSDIKQLEQTLNWLANSMQQRQDMGKRARRLYESEYSWAIMENRLKQIYHELCQNS